MTDERPLELLLIEDNPGDARFIEELLADASDVSVRASRGDGGLKAGGRIDRSARTLHHETRLESGLQVLDSHDVDVVLLDLGLPDSDGLATLEAVLERTDTPVVVLTGRRERETGVKALREGADEFLVKDEIGSDLLVRSIYHAIERREREQQLKQQRERLAALNDLNAVVRDISEALIEQSTREDVEQVVVDRLAASDSYRFAWIGEVDRRNKEVVLRAEAGVEGFLDDTTIPVEEDAPAGEGPTATAIRTGEIQVVQDATTDPAYEPFRERAEEYGYRSSAAVPLSYQGTLYGVLNVYTDRRNAFESEENAVIRGLGQSVGHGINAIERKQILVSDEVLELEFTVPNYLEEIGVDANPTGPIGFERVVPIGDGRFVVYGTADDSAIETVTALCEQMPSCEGVSTNPGDEDDHRFDLRLTEPPIFSSVAELGGRVTRAGIEDGTYTLVIQLPPSADVRRVTDSVQAELPNAQPVAQRRTVTGSDSIPTLSMAFDDRLTQRQQQVLEAAFFAGFFEWPRDSTGEEVAEMLDVSPPTFHQHLRTGERELLRAVFDADGGDDE